MTLFCSLPSHLPQQPARAAHFRSTRLACLPACLPVFVSAHAYMQPASSLGYAAQGRSEDMLLLLSRLLPMPLPVRSNGQPAQPVLPPIAAPRPPSSPGELSFCAMRQIDGP